MGEAERDLGRAMAALRDNRARLLRVVAGLSGEDLGRARPGGWTAGRVLQHVIESEATYAKLLAHQRGGQAPELAASEPADAAAATEMLAATRSAVERLVDGIDGETLYRLTRIGHEEYSPLSVLENVAAHDLDHIGQIEALLRGSTAQPAARDPADVILRPAVPADLPRLTEIYNYYVTETPITFDTEPFSVEERREWFGRYALGGRHRLLVAEEGGAVLGYASSSRFHARAAYDTTVEMTALCAPEAVGRGIGRALYARLMPQLQQEDIHLAVALITMPNRGSVALHQAFGFEQAALLPEVGRKFGAYHDVLWMTRRMP